MCLHKKEEQDTGVTKETAYANILKMTRHGKVATGSWLGLGVFVKTHILIGGKLYGPYPARIKSRKSVANHGAYRKAKVPVSVEIL